MSHLRNTYPDLNFPFPHFPPNQVDSAPRTHPRNTSHGTPTQASVASKPRKAEVPAISQAITSSSDSDSSSGSSSEKEEEKQGPQRAHSASSLGKHPGRQGELCWASLYTLCLSKF